jgi:hypothetical protein
LIAHRLIGHRRKANQSSTYWSVGS